MKENKFKKEYEKYEDVPVSLQERLDIMIGKLNIKKKEELEQEITRIQKIPWKHLSYTFYLVPHPGPRPRMGRNGIFYVKGAREIQDYLHELIDPVYLLGGIKLRCKAYIPTPSNMRKIERILSEMGLIPHISKPDFDNLVKPYLDAIQDYLIGNDSSVFDARISKYYSIKPRIELSIWYRDNVESKYNEKKILTYLKRKYK